MLIVKIYNSGPKRHCYAGKNNDGHIEEVPDILEVVQET
jgi:hypothetical protein